MRKLTALISALAALSVGLTTSTAAETRRPVALGAMLGDPSGLSGKVWLDFNRAVDLGLAYSLSDYLLIQSDYLVHMGDLAHQIRTNEPAARNIRPYIGIGGALYLSTVEANVHRVGFRRSGNSAGLAVRVPMGLEWSTSPLSIFAEIAPGIGILPSTFGLLNGSLGVRYMLR